MARGSNIGPGLFRAGWASARVMLLVAVLLLVAAKKDNKKSAKERFSWEAIKEAFTGEKEVELRPVEEMFEEAEENFNGRMAWYGRERHDYTKAKKLYRAVVDNYPFSSYGPEAELGVANCDYKLEDYEEAAVWYELFIKKHARHEKTPYAMFQLGMCQFELKLKPPRDQDHTRQALNHFQLLIETFPDSPYAADAREKALECVKDLAEHEMVVGDFYYKRKEYWSAAARYQGAYRDYPGAGFEAEAMYKEAECYDRLGKPELARPLFERAGADGSGEFGKKAGDRLKSLDKKMEKKKP